MLPCAISSAIKIVPSSLSNLTALPISLEKPVVRDPAVSTEQAILLILVHESAFPNSSNSLIRTIFVSLLIIVPYLFSN